ncbi:hypothetical protein [Pseudomonas viridiflava]|uniref:hypothetical protein n=1 Tax=Pseudomonas viridiflava TaxID=33069 RepID=UPI000F02613C|nr:hypothetical protein [Pseudomonas viridiflava]
MNIKLKPMHIGVIAAIVLAIIVLVVFFAGSTEKQTREQYDNFKSQLGLTDYLQEDDVSYSLLSRTLVVENPSIKLTQEMVGGSNADMMRGLMGLFDAGMGRQESVMGNSFARALDALNVRERTALSFEAKEMRIKRSGDDKDGELSVEINGINLSRPFVTTIANELVGPLDNPDELSPLPGLNSGSAVQGNHRWYANVTNKIPGTGSFIIDSLGLYGATLDAKVDLNRSSDSEGEIVVTMIHRVDGSEVGRIERKAVFATMPDLEELQTVAMAYIKGYALSAAGAGRVGTLAAGTAGEKLLRDSKLESYNLSYKGYEDLEDRLVGADSKDANKVSASCGALSISSHPLTQANKAKVKIDDSNCAIAVSLAKNGKYTESYTFNEDKTAFSEMMVNENYKVDVN